MDTQNVGYVEFIRHINSSTSPKIRFCIEICTLIVISLFLSSLFIMHIQFVDKSTCIEDIFNRSFPKSRFDVLTISIKESNIQITNQYQHQSDQTQTQSQQSEPVSPIISIETNNNNNNNIITNSNDNIENNNEHLTSSSITSETSTSTSINLPPTKSKFQLFSSNSYLSINNDDDKVSEREVYQQKEQKSIFKTLAALADGILKIDYLHQQISIFEFLFTSSKKVKNSNNINSNSEIEVVEEREKDSNKQSYIKYNQIYLSKEYQKHNSKPPSTTTTTKDNSNNGNIKKISNNGVFAYYDKFINYFFSRKKKLENDELQIKSPVESIQEKLYISVKYEFSYQKGFLYMSSDIRNNYNITSHHIDIYKNETCLGKGFHSVILAIIGYDIVIINNLVNSFMGRGYLKNLNENQIINLNHYTSLQFAESVSDYGIFFFQKWFEVNLIFFSIIVIFNISVKICEYSIINLSHQLHRNVFQILGIVIHNILIILVFIIIQLGYIDLFSHFISSEYLIFLVSTLVTCYFSTWCLKSKSSTTYYPIMCLGILYLLIHYIILFPAGFHPIAIYSSYSLIEYFFILCLFNFEIPYVLSQLSQQQILLQQQQLQLQHPQEQLPPHINEDEQQLINGIIENH